VDFAGNVNAFYVGASCDTGTNNTVIAALLAPAIIRRSA